MAGGKGIKRRQFADEQITDEEVAPGAAIATSKLQDGARFVRDDDSTPFEVDIDLNGHRISGLAAPVNPDDAARQQDVEDADRSYYHVQNTPSAVWTIVHNLGKRPSVQVIDSGGSIVEGAIAHLDVNTVQITFSASFGGSATLN